MFGKTVNALEEIARLVDVEIGEAGPDAEEVVYAVRELRRDLRRARAALLLVPANVRVELRRLTPELADCYSARALLEGLED